MARDDAQRVLPQQDSFWEAYYRRFVRYTGDHEAAADLLAKLRLNVLRWLQGGGKPNSLEAVIEVSYGNLLADWVRAKARRREVPLPHDHDEDPPAACSEPLPEEMVAREEWRAAVRVEIERVRMSPVLRAIVRHWDTDAKRLAEELGTTAKAIWNYRDRIKERLRANPHLRALFRDAPGW